MSARFRCTTFHVEHDTRDRSVGREPPPARLRGSATVSSKRSERSRAQPRLPRRRSGAEKSPRTSSRPSGPQIRTAAREDERPAFPACAVSAETAPSPSRASRRRSPWRLTPNHALSERLHLPAEASAEMAPSRHVRRADVRHGDPCRTVLSPNACTCLLGRGVWRDMAERLSVATLPSPQGTGPDLALLSRQALPISGDGLGTGTPAMAA